MSLSVPALCQQLFVPLSLPVCCSPLAEFYASRCLGKRSVKQRGENGNKGDFQLLLIWGNLSVCLPLLNVYVQIYSVHLKDPSIWWIFYDFLLGTQILILPDEMLYIETMWFLWMVWKPSNSFTYSYILKYSQTFIADMLCEALC